MSLIVKTVTRLVTGFILIFGLYILMYGHITPGGGFAGGVIIALAFILSLLAFGKTYTDDHALIGEGSIKVADVLGATGFLAIALAGYLLATSDGARVFFGNWLPHGTPFHLWSGGTLMFCNIAIGMKVGACLFGVLIVLAAFHGRGRGDVSEPRGD